MIIIPAIDLKDGKCVRLLQGRKEAVTVYSDNPISVAEHWVNLGAELLHIVDLDGAFTGQQRNLEVIKAIRKSIRIPVQAGGGIRDVSTVEMLIAFGIDRVIISTTAVSEPEAVKEMCGRFRGKVFAGIDAKDAMVAVRGWVEITDLRALDFAKKMESMGVAGIIYTDISRDGMLSGPNIEAIQKMVEELSIPVIASGGVSSIEDIKNLIKIKNLYGVIVGKALYEGRLDLREAIKIIKINR